MTEEKMPADPNAEVPATNPENEPGENASSASAEDGKPKKKKASFGRKVLYVIVGLIIFRVLIGIPMNTPRGPEDSDKLMLSPEAIVYNGPGELHAYLNTNIPLGSASKRFERFKSAILGQERDVLVHLPMGYADQKEPLPLVILFHGYLDRPQHLAMPFVKAFNAAQAAGRMPPVVLVLPDISIGGTGEDDPKTPDIDERMGSWVVNSNLGRYQDFVLNELIPWVRKTYNVSADPRDMALAGYSAGGSVALKLLLKKPDLAMTAVGVSAAIDLRYSINGQRLQPYNAKTYKPIADDRPNRPMMRAGLFGTYTDRWAFWPVFDSDKKPGPSWQKDLPVWQRLKADNPMDLARKPGLDLTGHAFYLVAGDRDNFAFQYHIQPFTEEVVRHGATVDPKNPLRPGMHSVKFVESQTAEIANWLGARFGAARSQELPAPSPLAPETDEESAAENPATPAATPATSAAPAPASEKTPEP